MKKKKYERNEKNFKGKKNITNFVYSLQLLSILNHNECIQFSFFHISPNKSHTVFFETLTHTQREHTIYNVKTMFNAMAHKEHGDGLSWNECKEWCV